MFDSLIAFLLFLVILVMPDDEEDNDGRPKS